jgi:hypothetical protein
MMTTLLLLCGLSISAVVVLIFQAFHAPEGHEDADGFHFRHKSVPSRKSVAVYDVDSAHGAAHAITNHFSAR